MSEVTIGRTTEYIVGSEATGSDGVCGDLRRIIVDPAAGTITHLVVEPRHHSSEGRLVPIALVAHAGNTIQLGCTTSEFQGLKDAEDTHVLAGAAADGSYTEEQKRSIPAFSGSAGGGGIAGLGPAPATGGMGVGALGAMGRGSVRQAIVTDDTVPAGEIQLCSGQAVQATDGAIGHVRGLAVDPGDHVTHVLLDEGHLWGKQRVAIPFSAITSVDDGVQLNLAKEQVRDLPAIDVPDWG